jgi:hypothetical protein
MPVAAEGEIVAVSVTLAFTAGEVGEDVKVVVLAVEP